MTETLKVLCIFFRSVVMILLAFLALGTLYDLVRFKSSEPEPSSSKCPAFSWAIASVRICLNFWVFCRLVFGSGKGSGGVLRAALRQAAVRGDPAEGLAGLPARTQGPLHLLGRPSALRLHEGHSTNYQLRANAQSKPTRF